ncbi:MAG TPA: DUF3467 domain-containing protein [Planctomycetaceae bacterium]
MAAEKTTSSTSDSPPALPASPQQVTVPTVEAESLSALYANFVRVNPSPEELVLDFGLNVNLSGGQPTPVKVSQRLVLNYYTAKRLWGGLGVALQRHEQTFGVLETDVNKRVLPPGQRPQR